MDFKDFINHFKDMTPDEIVADVQQSIEDFENLNTDNNTFGSEQVQKAVRISKERRAEASRENGKLGGRPRKKPAVVEDCSKEALNKRAEKALEALVVTDPIKSTHKSIKEPTTPQKSKRLPYQKKVYALPQKKPLPKSIDEVRDLVFKFNLDGDDAYQWWCMTMEERRGHDRYGNPIFNWKGALIRYCQAVSAKRAAPCGAA